MRPSSAQTAALPAPSAVVRPGVIGMLTGRGPGAGFALTVEQLLLAASLFWALSANRVFFDAAFGGRSPADPSAWGFGAALFVLLVAGHVFVLALLANRWTVKPLLMVLLPATAAAAYYMGRYGVHLDPGMIRNVLRTNAAESGELLTASFWWHLLLYAGVPMLLLARVRVVHRPWRRAALRRLLALLAAAVAAVGAVLLSFQPLASLVRNHKEARYLITPANYLWSLSRVVTVDVRGAAKPRQPIGLDAVAGASWPARRKPMVVVLVVGETARAANWGLNGYERQTTPQLVQLDVVNFAQVTSCGTDTEASLPCMFAPVGRRDYNERRIRGQESLLHVLARAGVTVQWRDNQSGCKGVCDGLASEQVTAADAPGLCADGRCLDEALLHDFDQRLRAAQGTQLWVLHTLGNHGPSYFRRYPQEFARFTPDCRNDDLHRCTVQEVVNAYDNALLYTDHFLARTIEGLRANAAHVDSALIYVSDHGESLGEHGLFLHGMPYAIAPDVQTRVPMLMWASNGLERAAGFAPGCLRTELARRATQPVAHDHLFHTVLGLLDVRTALYEPQFDLTGGCRAVAAG